MPENRNKNGKIDAQKKSLRVFPSEFCFDSQTLSIKKMLLWYSTSLQL